MYTTPNQGKPNTKPGGCGCGDCEEKDNPTQKSINAVRDTYCVLLYDTKGAVSKQEAKYKGETDLAAKKKDIFMRVEDNYRRYRDFDICTGSEILTANDALKANIAKLKDWNKSLNTALTTIAKQVKDLKAKFSDLQDAACALDRAYDDSCNQSQRKALTGTTKDNCGDPGTVPDACKTTGADLGKLICVAKKQLPPDADSIFKVASDVVGIQLFSNVDAFDNLQKDLATKAAAFESQVNSTMKTRKGEVDKAQDELVISVKSRTQAYLDRNWQRAQFEGYKDATRFLCCPDCDALCSPQPTSNQNKPQNQNTQNNSGNCNDDCPPRLKYYENCVCQICKDVQKTFCCNDPIPVPQPPTTPPPTGC
ncbi:MAG: hypothetical protein BGO55_03540 [Sphingobacteriales bacterium 50-39]|nr:hypothetical protein [Sphingobacteriales bacterium]OJW55622.1 MAG: hypothetical protein BGO55_03540 [Sphingobacteriales bacterium 50-39]